MPTLLPTLNSQVITSKNMVYAAIKKLLVCSILLFLSLSVKAEGPGLAYPHVAIYGSASSLGKPFVDDSGKILDQVVQNYARYQVAIIHATPLTDMRKDISAALKAANPNLKLFAYTLPLGMWCGTGYHVDSYYRHYWDLLQSLSGKTPPYDCNDSGEAFLALQSGGSPFSTLIINVNIARRRLENGTYRYYIAEAIADQIYADVFLAKYADGAPIWDGIFFDVFCDSLSWMETSAIKIDYAQAGFGNNNNDPANRTAFMAAWKEGFTAFANRLRSKIGDNTFPLVGNCGQGTLHSQFNGWMSENFPAQNGGTWYTNMFREVGGHVLYDRLFRSPTYNFLFTAASNSYDYTTLDNQRKARFGLASASMLEGGFAGFGDGEANAVKVPYHQWWYDEYAVNVGSGESVKAREFNGWLGAPLGEQYQQIWADASTLASNGNMESGYSGWQFGKWAPAAAQISLDSSSAGEGSNSLKIDISAIGGGKWYVNLYNSSTFPVTYGQPYALTFWAKASKDRNIDLNLTGPAGAVYAYQLLPIGTTWKRYQVVLLANDSNATGSVRFDLGGDTGSVWLDGIQVQNLVTNVYRRDFSHGTILLNPWYQDLDFSLERDFKKIKGALSTLHNDGSTITAGTQLRVKSSDALFLLNVRDSDTPNAPTDLKKK